jgi:hypothetical protein
LEEDAVEQTPLAHHAASEIAHHGVLQTGENVVAREAVVQRLSGHVGDEHCAGLAEIGRPLAARREPPELLDVFDAVGQRLLLEERAGAGAAHAIHVGVDDAAALDVDELGVLAADLDDGEAAAAGRVEPRGGGRVRDDLVLDGEPRAEMRIRGPEHGGRGVASRSGDAHGDHWAGQHLADLGDQRLRRFYRVALGAAVDAGKHHTRADVQESGLGTGGAEIQAEHGRRAGRGNREA